MYSSLVLDVDSTLSGIEGIDFLAARRGPEVGERIARLTERAMAGAVPLDSVYGERLRLIQPALADIQALQHAYVEALAPDARTCIARLRAAGVRLVLVSGGIRQAIEPLARQLGFADDELHAVTLAFDATGSYAGFDAASPLATQRGKAAVVGILVGDGTLPRPVLAVGDGSTDIAMRDTADVFAAFTGFARRPNVVAAAAFAVASFPDLERATLAGSPGVAAKD